MKATVKIALDSYIADPYWPEKEREISIRKQSGIDRARSEDKREQSLSAFLKRIGMTEKEYAQIVALANQKWYRADRSNQSSAIIVPRRQLEGMLVKATESAPAGSRFPAENFRTMVQLTDFVTDKTAADGTFDRFVPPKDGKGNPLSNQRRFESHEYISNATATGSVTFDGERVKLEALKTLLTFALASIGVGASRKMGYGRGRIVSFEVL